MALRKPKTHTWFDTEWMTRFNKGWLVMMVVIGVLALLIPMFFGVSAIPMIVFGIIAYLICIHFKQDNFARGWAAGLIGMGLILLVIPMPVSLFLLVGILGLGGLYLHDRLFAKYY